MPHDYPRPGRGVPARRGFMLLALLLSCAAALAYGPFGRTGAQNDTDQQDAAAAVEAVVVPGSGLERLDPQSRHSLSTEGDARAAAEQADAPSQSGEVITSAAAEVT